MKMTLLKDTLFASMLLLSGSLAAQDLTLFESVGADDGLVERPEGFDGREQRNLASGPAFTLVGTSRIGDRHRATLMSSAGQIVTVDTTPGSAQDIPDHPGFRVTDINSRRVVIANPSDTPCIVATDKGVSCDVNGASQLTLTTAAPLAVTEAVASSVNNGVPVTGDPAAQSENGDVVPDNPFAAALRAAAANEANGQPQGSVAAERFQPRRIGPDEVPPGMRVVRTPFGDRLVELRQ